MPKSTVNTLLQRDGDSCHYCNDVLGEDITREHVVPRALGGPTRLDNLVLAHARCNNDRGHTNAEHHGCEFCALARAKYSTVVVSTRPIPHERVRLEDMNDSVYKGYGTVTYDPEQFLRP